MPYYGPNEDPSLITLERTFVAGIFVQGVGYGAQLVLYVMCVGYLWRERKRRGSVMLFLLAYLTLLLCLLSLWEASAIWTTENIYINNRNFPGGPWAYFMANQDLPENVIFLITAFVMTFLADFLVLWRCWVIWASFQLRLLAVAVVSVPFLVQIASLVIGIIWCFRSSRPGHSPFDLEVTNLGVSFFATSISVNVIVTILITLRLYLHRRAMMDTLTPAHAKEYMSLATIIIESAALYSISALALIIAYALRSPSDIIFMGVNPHCQQIAGYLIILRVVRGRAWDVKTGAVSDSGIQLKTLECSTNTSARDCNHCDRNAKDVKARDFVSDLSLPDESGR